MANEFIARKGLIALNDSQITGNLNILSGSLTVESSGSTIFEVNGSEGQLFSITDSLSGSLFAVSDVSGLPILEVFSDDRIVAGAFNNEALVISGSHTTLKDTDITGSLEVIGDITGSGALNLNDGQNNIIVSNQSPNLDSTADNNIILGLGAAQNMSGSGADRNTIIGHNAGKELSNINTRYNTIIGYNAFSDHSGSNSSNHTIIGYNAGLGMSSAGYPGGATIIGANASSTNASRTMAIGYAATSGYNSHAIGTQAVATGDGALAIGANASATGNSTVVIGQQSSATNGPNIVIGRGISSTSSTSISIGSGGNTYQGVLIGYNARGVASYGAAIGYQVGNGAYSATIGYRAGQWNVGSNNVSIGNNAMSGVSGSTNVSQTVAIGDSALQNITTGTFNTAIGYQALKSTSTGGSNVAVGYLALANATTQTRNTAVGYKAFDEINGTNNVSFSTGLGHGVSSGGNDRVIVIGHNISAAGSTSISIGGTAGYQGVTVGAGAKNGRGISIGRGAGGLLQGSTDHNIFIGNDSGYNGDGCRYNTFIGQFSGQNLSGGDNNVLLGYQSGYSIANGSNNIFLGYQAGYNETGSDKLYIENSNSSTPLIYGEFDNDLVRINGTFETSGSTTISGSLTVTGRITELSTERFKENIHPLTGSLEKANQLQGVSFNRIGQSEKEIGFIAEQVAAVFPELVDRNENNEITGVQYSRVTAVLLESVKELSSKLNEMEARLERLENK